MLVVFRVLAVVAGVTVLVATLGSAIKTVILPRALVSTITRVVFLSLRGLFLVLARPSMSFERRDRILAMYAPLGLIVTLAAWLSLTLVAYMLIFWGLDLVSWREAFEISGSSLFTLGSARPEHLGSIALVFTEAAIGLFLLALMITYLPSIYSSFSRRELGVTALAVRAGEPAWGVTMIERFWRLERIGLLHDVWVEWERWFVDVEESHSSLPVLCFFRSPQPDHSWVTAAGAILDAAALSVSLVDIEHDVQADICLRAGYLSLRRITDFFGVAYDPDPRADDPISIRREEFDAAVHQLAEAGVPLKADLEAAWVAFAGWRVNYDSVLVALCNITSAPPAPWSSDRSGERTIHSRVFGDLPGSRRSTG